MPENDIWTLLDQNLSGLEKSGQMEMVVETPIPDDLDKILDANLMAIEQAQRPSIGGPKGASLPVIGPAKRPAEAESIIPPWKSAEEITGKAAAQRQADLIGPLSAAPRVLEKVVGAAAGGLEGATSGLVKLSDKISQATGIERGFVLDWIGKTFGNTARYFDRMSRGGEGEAPLPYIVDFAANAAGRASIDIGAMMSMGPLGMPVWTAFNAWKDAPEGKETEALLSGFATGAALHGIFKAINLLPSSLTVPTLGATGTGLGFLQGLDPSHALEEGVTWGGLGLLGGNGKVTKEEFLSRYNEIAAFDNIKAKRFLSQFAAAPDGNIMFVDKAPLLRGDMRGVQPFFTSDMIEAAGGPKELAKKLGGVMASEYNKLDANIRAMVEARKSELQQAAQAEAPPTVDSPTVKVAPVATLEGFKSEIVRINEGRVTPEQADNLAKVIDAFAKTRGMTADEYIAKRMGAPVAGGEPADDALFKMLRAQGAAEKEVETYYRETYGDTDGLNYLQETLRYLHDRTKRYTDQEYAEAGGTEVTPEGQSGTHQQPLAPNLKTLMSIDLTNICRFREMGNVCVYCYVEQPRTTGDPRAKSTMAPMPYESSMILSMPDELVAYFNKMGGLRMYSSADYAPSTDPILARIFADAQKRGLKIKAITKNPEFVLKYGDTPNLSINISSDFAPETVARIFGVDIDTAVQLRKLFSLAPTVDEALSWAAGRQNINVRYVSVNAEDTLNALRDNRVSVVTGYHGRVKAKLLEVMEAQNPEVIKLLGRSGAEKLAQAFENQKPKNIMKKMGEQDLELAKNKMCCQTGRCGTCAVCCGFETQAAIDKLAKLVSGEPVASVEFEESGRAVIRAFQNSNIAGMAHEVAHIFRRDLTSQELGAVERALRVKDGKWTVENEESFADKFEIYLRSGKAPTPELEGVFAKFKDWLTKIYTNVRASFGRQVVSPELSQVFDEMLGKEPEVYEERGSAPPLVEETSQATPAPAPQVAEPAPAAASPAASHPLRVLEAKLLERLPTATTEAERADLMSALQEVRDIIKREAGESTPVATEIVAAQPETPPAAVEPEAPKPAAPSKKKVVEAPDEDFVPQPSVMMGEVSKRGQVTTADNLRDMDLVLRNNAPVGMVEKGQGAATIKALREKYPDDEFTISGSPVRGTAAETPESLEMSISKQQAREARMRKKSLLAEGDNPYGDSEIFGDAAEADAKALEAAKKLEAEAAMPEVGDFYRDKDGNQVTIGVQREPGNVTVKTGFGGTWDEPLDQFLKKYRFEEKSVYSREQAAKAAKSKAKAKPAAAPPAAPAAAPAPQPAQEQGLTIGTRLVDKSSGEPFVVKEDRGTFIDIASEDGKTTRSVRADAINSLFDRLGGGKMGIVAPGVVELGKAIDKFKTAFLDKFYPIHATVDALRDAGIGPDTVNDPSVLVRLLAGIPGMAETKIRFKRFTRDASGNLVFNGESLNDIIKPFIHGKDLGRFNDYLVYRRALEVDKNSKGTIKTGVDLDRARLFVARNRNTYDAAATKFTDYFHSLLDELVDSGLMERQTVHDLKVNNPEYAPMKRVLEEMDRHGIPSALKEALDKVGNPVKRMRGSELDIVPPTESAILMTYEITSAVERNRAAQAIIGLRDLSPEMARIITKAKPKMRKVRDMATGEDVWAIADTQDPDVVAVSFDGHRQYWKVPQDIADSMKMIHQAGLGDFVKLLAKPARALRSGATLSPEFMLRNPMRDVLTAYMNAKGGFNPLIDFPKGLFQLIAKPEEYWRWKASGGEWSMLASMDRAFGTDAIKQMEKESQGGLARFKKSPLGYLEAISEAGEKPTRLGVFSRSKRKGMSDLEAAIESREASTDFHTRGSSGIVRSWGAVSTFFNARLQTTVKLARTAKEDPVRFAIKGFAAAGIPSALLYYFNRNDPDYWKRSELERDTFWFLPVEIAGRQVKIPKGEIGLMFGTTVEKVLQYLDDKAEYRPKVTEFLGRLVQNSVPIGNWGEGLPVAIRPIMEWVTNRSFYYGTPLVQDTLEKKAAYLQYKPQTSETMKALGKGLARVFPEGGGASPTKLENTVRGYTGGLGRLALRATDWVGDKLGAFDAGERPSDPINIPGVSGLLSQKAVGFESEPARRFYEIAENLERYKTTWKELAKKGDSEGVKRWMDTHPTETKILMSGLDKEWSSKRDELSSLRKAMNLIVENKTLSGPEKARALEVLNKQVSALVDPMWKVVNQLEKAPTPRR